MALLSGCEHQTVGENVEGEIPETNLFPLAVGRAYVYTAYSLDTTSGQKVAASEHRTLRYVHSPLTVEGKSGFRVIDSVYTNGGGVAAVDTTIFALENGDLLVYYDSWLGLFKRSAGFNKEYVAGQFEQRYLGFPIVVVVKATILQPEAVAVPLGTFQAYRLQVRFTTELLGQTFELKQFLFFTDGVGPVKSVQPVQSDPLTGVRMQGRETLLTGKNF